ncbi:hypothetical protein CAUPRSCDRAFT_12208 [Caulochytrium protostelioides]|uniref:CCHC-type domain-containing protein n=1 Tax=Caulochytrium protostelioides TaxID=1555241 RepID=A0A4P9WTS7_9FUNG|nr:hypothetical protein CAUPRSCDRAFT_12208 [Caulochytrium protostelioides]
MTLGQSKDTFWGTAVAAVLNEAARRSTQAKPAPAATALVTRQPNWQRGATRAIICKYCDRRGHTADDCYKNVFDERKKTTHSAHVAASADNINSDLSLLMTHSITFCSNADGKHDEETWIVDSGASCHLSPHIHHFTKLDKLTTP